MPGLAGILSSIPLPEPSALIQRLQAVYAVQGVHFWQRSWHGPQTVICNTLTGLLPDTLDQPFQDPDGTVVLFLEGEILNAAEWRPLLRDLPPRATLAEALLALFRRYGPECGALLEGAFNLAVYEPPQRRLTLLNDHLSSKPLYYMQQNDRLYFASEKKAILAVLERSPALDPVGLLEVFALRHNLGTRTFVDGLHFMPPGARLQFQDGRLTLISAPRLTFRVARPTPTVELLADAWSDQLRAATLRRMYGKRRIVLSLTGGLDSRAVACAIPRDFRPLEARTQGYPDTLEVLCAAAIAQRLGIEHRREDPETLPYSLLAPKIVWRTEGAVPIVNIGTLAGHAAIKRHGDFLMAGQLGGMLAGSRLSPFMFWPRSRARFVDAVLNWYWHCPEPQLRRVFNPAFLRAHLPAVAEAFRASFAPIEAEANTQAFELWDLYERQRRMSLCAAPVDTHLFEHIRPFLDRRYIEFVLTLPTSLRFGVVLYQIMIRQIGPEVQDIPYANTGLPLARSIPAGLAQRAYLLGRKTVHKLSARLGQDLTPPPAEPLHLTARTRQDPGLRRLVEDFAASAYCDPDVFDPAGIRQVVDAHYAGVRDHLRLLAALATFAVALPYGLYAPPAVCPPEAEPLILAAHPDPEPSYALW